MSQLPGEGSTWPGQGGEPGRSWPGRGATWPGSGWAEPGPLPGQTAGGGWGTPGAGTAGPGAAGGWEGLGASPGTHPAGPAAGSGWGPPPVGRPRRHLAGLGAAFLATALLAGGAGAGIALALSQPSPAPSAASLPTVGPAKPGASAKPSADQSVNIHAIAAEVGPAVVDLTATDPGGSEDEGTGMVLTSSGVVLTNNHVVEGSTTLSAQVAGVGKKYPATFLGADPAQDVALVQLHGGSHWKTVPLGNSNAVQVGDPVVAIGNALALPGPPTVTSGIISAVGRSITVSNPSSGGTESLHGLFQTSAAISSGDSGGPLVDAAGKVIGMDTAAASGGSLSGVTASNVGFAIPINQAVSIARQILEHKASATIVIGSRAIMGVQVESVACAEGRAPGCSGLGSSGFFAFPFGFGSPFGFGAYQAPVSQGAVVASLLPGYPAANAGLSVGDVITSFNGKAVTTPAQLSAAVKGQRVGAKVTVGWVGLDGSHHSAKLTLMAAPAP
jgi:S1-C subfamily serine protease